MLQEVSHVHELREQVRSRGGTTNAAFEVFDGAKLPEVINQAVRAAFERSKQLAQ